ncbi:hypothetical protein GBA52_028823 [Prunus armeniaca]|nr:hypothetical protein GBA52_028823 [Prunus armeniaca]
MTTILPTSEREDPALSPLSDSPQSSPGLTLALRYLSLLLRSMFSLLIISICLLEFSSMVTN